MKLILRVLIIGKYLVRTIPKCLVKLLETSLSMKYIFTKSQVQTQFYLREKKITFYVHNVSYYSLQIWVRTWDVMKINLSCEEKKILLFFTSKQIWVWTWDVMTINFMSTRTSEKKFHKSVKLLDPIFVDFSLILWISPHIFPSS